jgi:hypothetical protein
VSGTARGTSLKLALGLALACLTAGAAHAERKMYSYDPISPDAKRLTGAGLTVLFDKKLTGTRVEKVLATGVPVQGRLIDGREKDLGPGGLKAMAVSTPTRRSTRSIPSSSRARSISAPSARGPSACG